MNVMLYCEGWGKVHGGMECYTNASFPPIHAVIDISIAYEHMELPNSLRSRECVPCLYNSGTDQEDMNVFQVCVIGA